jgi:hypothetical protein
MSKEKYQTLRKLYVTEGEMVYHLAVFGDFIAKREGYKDHQDMDAVYFYLVQKYSWPPAQVRGMSFEDIRFVLAEEMTRWKLPKEAL